MQLPQRLFVRGTEGPDQHLWASQLVQVSVESGTVAVVARVEGAYVFSKVAVRASKT